jgi:hypothetical protein
VRPVRLVLVVAAMVLGGVVILSIATNDDGTTTATRPAASRTGFPRPCCGLGTPVRDTAALAHLLARAGIACSPSVAWDCAVGSARVGLNVYPNPRARIRVEHSPWLLAPCEKVGRPYSVASDNWIIATTDEGVADRIGAALGVAVATTTCAPRAT